MKLQWKPITLRVANEFRTSKAIRRDKQTIWVQLEHEGIVGWGEAVPMDTYRQTLESADATLSAIAAELPDDPWHYVHIVDHLLEKHDSQRATVAAFDAAIHDWIGKRLGIPVVRMMGLNPDLAPQTSYSIGIQAPANLANAIAPAADYPILKVKLGAGHDVETIAAIRSLAPAKRIRVDANAAWTIDQALELLPRLAEFNIEFVEQPLASDDLNGLRRLKKSRICPIIADESCVRSGDILRLTDCVDGINIKLSKCGGILEATRMIHLARATGLKVMLGCMVESSLGIAAAAQLAPLADWLDLDGHLLLREEPFCGLEGPAGRLTIGAGPGLGVFQKESSLKKADPPRSG